MRDAWSSTTDSQVSCSPAWRPGRRGGRAAHPRGRGRPAAATAPPRPPPVGSGVQPPRGVAQVGHGGLRAVGRSGRRRRARREHHERDQRRRRAGDREAPEWRPGVDHRAGQRRAERDADRDAPSRAGPSPRRVAGRGQPADRVGAGRDGRRAERAGRISTRPAATSACRPARPGWCSRAEQRRSAPAGRPRGDRAVGEAADQRGRRPRSASTAPVQPTSPLARSTATTATSVPPSTRVAAALSASTASSRGVSQLPAGHRAAPAGGSSAPRIGGLSSYSPMPAATSAADRQHGGLRGDRGDQSHRQRRADHERQLDGHRVQRVRGRRWPGHSAAID